MKVIGLAGGSGSGKGVVCQIFSTLGFQVVDTDSIYHEMTSYKSECVVALVLEFGDIILNDVGGLDRRKLSSIVFGDGNQEKLSRLNQISHYYVLNATKEIIKKANDSGVSAIVIDAPLLFESGFDKECDFIVSVLAPKDLRVERIVKRDGISEEKAKLRISHQLSDEFLKQSSDFIIVNDGEIGDLHLKVSEIAEKILNFKE